MHIKTSVVVAAAAVAACQPAAVGPAPAAPTAPTAPSGDLAARSHAILDAFDRHELAAITPVLAADYVHCEGSVVDRAAELAGVAKQAPGPSQFASRTWSDERVFAHPGGATFVGKARERPAGSAGHRGDYYFDGWYTMSWVEVAGGWQLAYLGWQVAGAPARAAEWDQMFTHGTGFEHAPNRLLVDTAAAEHPGDALDVAMGQGRNAIALAAAGWRVLGVDISKQAMNEARQTAEARHVAVATVEADLASYDYGVDRYDLVALMYAFPALKRLADVRRAVRPGGLVVYEYFSKDASNPDAPAPGDLAREFGDGWEIVKDEVVDAVPDWGSERTKLERFVARRRR